jgi:hypothetical protein
VSADEPLEPAVSQALLTVLTTEHFTLQGARGATISESSARAALFVGAVSSALIALGFIAQTSELGRSFDIFALVVLPTLWALGIFTFARLVESSIEDLLYGRAINRIRHFYRELAGDQARYLLLGGSDDVGGVLANMGLARPSRWQLFFGLASMIAVLDAVVAGAVSAVAAGTAGAPLWIAAGIGGTAASCSCFGCLAWQRKAHIDASAGAEVLFPSTRRP